MPPHRVWTTAPTRPCAIPPMGTKLGIQSPSGPWHLSLHTLPAETRPRQPAVFSASLRMTRVIHLGIVNLAGVPSIVHALFGVGAFVLFLGMGTSILAASLTLGIMTLPVIIASTREALAAVPQSFREACWNVGATRWQTIWHVVLPNSISGILTGIILQVSRAAGETAPILFTGAAFYLPYLPISVRDQCMALSMHLFTLATQVPNVPESMTYGTALVLVGVVMAVNAASIAVRSRLRRSRRW